MRIIYLSLILIFLCGCSTPRGRFLLGATTGGLCVGGAAVALSPNQESRGMNALVFGLVGALSGGALALLLSDDAKIPKSESSLQSKEALHTSGLNANLYLAPSGKDLPKFVKDRLQPALIEEATEPDTLSEDGTLHEPHKVYRIQRPAELYSLPKEHTNE